MWPSRSSGAKLLHMTEGAKINLSRLREIGWALWDPIDLKNISDGEWREGGACADEYDRYMLQVVTMLQ